MLDTHRHKYLRSFYKHIVAFHHIIELMNKSVSWENEEHVGKLRILWDHLVCHTEEYKKNPIEFDEMVKIKNGAHKYWKEIGFQVFLSFVSDDIGMTQFSV